MGTLQSPGARVGGGSGGVGVVGWRSEGSGGCCGGQREVCWSRGSYSESIQEGGHNGSQTNCASSEPVEPEVAMTSNHKRFVQKRRSDGKCDKVSGRPWRQAGVALV